MGSYDRASSAYHRFLFKRKQCHYALVCIRWLHPGQKRETNIQTPPQTRFLGGFPKIVLECGGNIANCRTVSEKKTIPDFQFCLVGCALLKLLVWISSDELIVIQMLRDKSLVMERSLTSKFILSWQEPFMLICMISNREDPLPFVHFLVNHVGWKIPVVRWIYMDQFPSDATPEPSHSATKGARVLNDGCTIWAANVFSSRHIKHHQAQ